MRNAFLVAWREYIENAKTKGFWISLLVLPAILVLSVQLPFFLEKKVRPVRYFVLADNSGLFERIIDESLAREYQRNSLQALLAYARKNARPDALAPGNPPANPARTGGFQQALDELARAIPAGPEGRGSKPDLKRLQRRISPYLNPDAPPFEEPREQFQRVPLPEPFQGQPAGKLALELKPYLRGEKMFPGARGRVPLFAAILIPPAIGKFAADTAARRGGELPAIEYWAANLADPSLQQELGRILDSEIRRQAYLARGVDMVSVREIESLHAPLVALDPKKQEGKERVDRGDIIRQWAPVGFVYLLWLAIFIIAQMLLNNTIEEKSNRIVELLLSSITPGELMAGKLAGIAAIGFTMLAVWLASFAGLLFTRPGGPLDIGAQVLHALTGSYFLVAFAVYFVVGYLMYAGILLSIGAICNTVKDAQNYLGVMTLILIVPLLTMTFIPKDPNGFLARVLSWIPIYTPFVMMNRAAADPPLVDVIGTMLLLVVCTALILKGAGKIFRAGILRTGQPPRILELISWLKTKSS